jgi:phosphatidylglycerophosphate synthase
MVAGAAFYLSADGVGSDPAMLLMAAAFIQLRLLCNLLDGMLAIEGGFKTKTGEMFNELPDRIEDIVILAGAGYAIPSLVYGVALGWAAAVLAVLTAYVRLLGASLGTSELFLGPMAKQHRMFALTIFTLLAAAQSSMAMPVYSLHVGLATIVAGSIVTIVRRTRRIAGNVSAT